MMFKKKIDKFTVVLLSVLLVAFLFRFVGVVPGYHPNHSDETTIYSSALDFIKHKNFEPYRYEYPALTNLINYFIDRYFFIPLGWLKFILVNINSIVDGQIKFPLGEDVYNRIFQMEILGTQDRNLLFWSRYVTALFGLGVVWITYITTKKLFNKYAGLITAFLVAINYRQVLNSHLGLPDIYNAFFFMFSFWGILYFREKINLRRALLCGLILGLHLSTKYQYFPFFALLLVYLEKAWQKAGFIEKFKYLFNRYFLIVPLAALTVFIFLNPYLFINFETAISQLAYASLKYGLGSMKLLVYPYSYLYKIGIGRVTSLLIIVGIMLGLVKERWKTLLLLSMIIPYFFFFTFYTSGGFYTRNFVSVIPQVLIFAGYTLVCLLEFKPKAVFVVVAMAVFSLASFENLKNSIKVIQAYRQPWNRVILEGWIKKNIPEGRSISAHSSVGFPDDLYKRLPYDIYPAFALEEFAEMHADYAVTSFDWATVDFYGWMRQTGTVRYWTKPTNILEQTFPAMAVEEMTSFVVYDIINPWQAPDLDFMVVKIPKYSADKKELLKSYSFKNGSEGWSKEGALWFGDTQLEWKNQSLVINEGGSASQILHWESEPIEILNTNGYEIDYEIRTNTKSVDKRDGFIFVKSYASYEDAKNNRNRLTVRLGARNDIYNQWVTNKLIGGLSENSTHIRIGFQAYNSVVGEVGLRNVNVYKTKVNLENVEGTKHIELDNNIAFPVSHGNL